MSLHLIKDDLRGAAALLEAQKLASLDEQESMHVLFSSIFAHVSKLPAGMSQSDVLDITKLSNEGPWTSDQKKQLALALVKSNTGLVASKADMTPQNQQCHHFENMIDEQAWGEIRAKNSSMLSRAQTIARVAASINLVNPDQPTLFRMCAILAWSNEDWEFSQANVWDYMYKIQTFIKANKPKGSSSALPYIAQYQVSASDLPLELKQLAYGDGELPVDVTIPELDAILAGKKMRGRNNEPAWLQHIPDEFRGMVAAQVFKQRGTQSPLLPVGSRSQSSDAYDQQNLHASMSMNRGAHAPSASMYGSSNNLFKPPMKNELQEVKKEELKQELQEVKKEETGAEPDGSLAAMEAGMSAAFKARAKDANTRRKTKKYKPGKDSEPATKTKPVAK